MKSTPGKAPDDAASGIPSADQENAPGPSEVWAEEHVSGSFWIVGIGASAGGIGAFELLFKHLHPDSGMAFIVVQHLPRGRKSELARVLQQHTTMNVCEVNDGTLVEPNCVYVIPPDQQLTIHDRRLQLAAPSSSRGHSAPIDLFLRSLAEDQKENAACVILSGYGSDGMAGLRAIKEAGGVTMVQDPADAEHDSMPNSAISTGVVDYVLPVGQLAARLLEIGSGLYAAPDAPLPDQDKAVLHNIFAHLRAHTGHDFAEYKRSTVLRRIERRMAVHHAEALSEYFSILLVRPEETEALLRSLLISVTYFFRDQDAFRTLEHQIIPHLFREQAGDGIRVWVPGCSTGEEAYSIAILLLEYATQHSLRADFQIFATDIDEDAIAFGRNGIYSEAVAADVSSERLERFFTWEGEGYRVRKELREKVLFAPHSIIKDPPFSRISLISCRNVLIYLNREVQDQVFEVFHYALQPGGYLFLGMSESADRASNLFGTMDKKHHVFQRRSVTRKIPRVSSLSVSRMERHEQPPSRKLSERRTLSVADLHHKALLERYAPPSVVVNENNDIVHILGNAGRYLHISEGEPTQSLLRMVRKELRIELRTSLHQARRVAEPIYSGTVELSVEGHPQAVRLYVMPMSDPEGTSGFMQIVFEAMPSPSQAPVEATGPTEVDRLVEQLEDELLRTRESLQTTIEDLERSNEELKASNEELLSTNEELQSTAEELETSQEELQSMNEELITVNQELKEKVEEVSRSNSDLQNLIVSTDIGTIFLDREMRIKRYTPRITDLFNITASDVGRPLAHFTHRIDYEHLLDLAERVLKRHTFVEREIRSREGRWYLVRILPYRTVEDWIDGVVITFVDITERRRAETTLVRQQQQISALVENAPDVIARFDSNLCHVYINPVIETFTGIARQNFLGKTNRDMGYSSEAVDYWDAALRHVFETGRGQTIEFDYTTSKGAIHFAARLVPELGPDGKVDTVLAIARDITDRKRAEDVLRESERRFRSMADSTPMLIWISGLDKECTYFNKAWLDFTGRTLEQEAGAGWTEGVHPDDYERCLRTYTKAFDAREAFTMEYRLRRHDGMYRWILDIGVPQVGPDGAFEGYIGSCMDIHDRKELESKMRQRALQQAVVAELGLRALERIHVSELMDIAVQRVRDTLEADICHVLELQPDKESFTVRVGAGLRPGFVGQATLSAGEETLAGFMLSKGEPIVVKDISADERFKPTFIQLEHEVVSAMGVLIGTPEQPFGVLTAMTKEAYDFTPDDRNFLQAIANLLHDAIERFRIIQALEQVNVDLDQRVAERTQELKASEERWRMLVERNPDPIVISREGEILYINPSGATLIGASTAEELFGRSLLDFAPPAVHEAGRQRLQTVAQGKPTDPMESRLIRLDGTELLVETFSTPVLFEMQPAAQTVVRDVTERKRAEETVRLSEERFAKAFRSAPVAMIITRMGSGRLVDVNDHFTQMTGFNSEEVVGQKASDISLSIHRILQDRVGNTLEAGDQYRDVEAQIITREDVLLDVLSSGEVIEFGGEACLLSMFYDITDRKRLEQEVLDIAEGERQRIGQDLHDGLGQQLTGIAFLSKLLEQNLKQASPEHVAQMERIVELLSQAINFTRNLARVLSPVDVQADTLIDALRRLIDSTCEYFDIACRFEVLSKVAVPNNRAATHLYRIVQEAINNVLKHAGASEVAVQLVAEGDQGVLRIRDNGRGIPDGDFASGMGMRTMRYRSNIIGGTFTISPAEGGGTVIEVRFPLVGA